MDNPKKLKKVKKTINGKTTTVTLKPSSIKEALKYGGFKTKGGEGDEPTKTTKSTSAPKSASDLAAMSRKEYRDLKQGANRAAKLDRIASGKRGDRADNIIKGVSAGVEVVANATRAARDAKDVFSKQQLGGRTKSTYKTGGMVNSNAKVSALKSAGSKGVKSGVNIKTIVSKIAKGRVGGTSTAPKKAVPQAKTGMSVKSKKSC